MKLNPEISSKIIKDLENTGCRFFLVLHDDIGANITSWGDANVTTLGILEHQKIELARQITELQKSRKQESKVDKLSLVKADGFPGT